MTRSLVFFTIAIVFAAACGGSTEGSSSSSNSPNGDPNGPNNGVNPGAGVTGNGPGTAKPNNPNPQICTGVGEAACPDGFSEVTSVEEFIELFKVQTITKDQTINPAFGKALRPSGDIYVTKTLEITGADLRKYQEICKLGPPPPPPAPKCFDWTFAPEKPFHATQNQVFGHQIGKLWPKGVECLEVGTEGRDGCERIRITAGTAIRIQSVLEPFYFMNSQRYYVRILRSCDAPCAVDELRCGASDTCIKTGKDFCILCEGKDAKVCACRDGCKAALDGDKCEYDLSDDHGTGGTCSAGVCASK